MSSASEPSDPRQAELAIAHTCASLVRAVVVLDQSSKDGPLDGSLSDALNMAVTALGTLGSWTQHTSVEARIKLFRSLEQLRRRCLAKLDALRAPARPERPSTPGASPNTFAFSSCGPLQALLLAVVDQLEQRIRVPWENAGSAENAAKLPSPADLAADVVQTLRMLSNAMFEVRHPKTHTECSAFLERCISLLMADATDSISISTRAENLHYVSSSFYNLGGRLYSDRRPELAVPFLARACETGARAEELFAAAEEGIRSEVMVQEDVKAKRLDALVHKYEHLAVCYRLTSQIKVCRPVQDVMSVSKRLIIDILYEIVAGI